MLLLHNDLAWRVHSAVQAFLLLLGRHEDRHVLLGAAEAAQRRERRVIDVLVDRRHHLRGVVRHD